MNGGIGECRWGVSRDDWWGDRTSPDTAWNDSRDTAVAKVFGAPPWAGGGGLSAIFPRRGRLVYRMPGVRWPDPDINKY